MGAGSRELWYNRRMSYPIIILFFSIALLPALGLVLVPFFPAFWYMALVTGIFFLIDGFVHITAGNALLLFGIFLFSILVDWSAGLLGAKLGGARWKSLLYGAIGGVAGFLLLPPFGVIAGLFLGVLMGELWQKRVPREAVLAASGAVIGTVAGILINFILAVTFVVLFFIFALL